MSFQPPMSEQAMPTCYRHPDRPTRLSCGRCGKPLCPDCVQNGPVGVRCRECLRPARVITAETFAPPQRVSVALAAGAGMALLWTALLITLGLHLQRQMSDPALVVTTISPNLLLSGIAGGLIGWVIWRTCGRTCNRLTIIAAVALAAAVPLLTTLALAVLQHAMTLLDGDFALRLLAAIVLSTAFALLLTTQHHWEE